MRLGILGGTFDPIHHGHLAVAEECRVALRLDRVLFLPAGDPPHKKGRRIAPAEHRVAMVEAAIASNPCFRLSRVDVDRKGPSYTIDSLEELGRQHPGAKLFFLMGADSLVELLEWHRPERIIESARLVATNRPGSPRPDPSALEARLPGLTANLDVVEIPDLAISGSELRRRVAAGRPIKYQVPDDVDRYIVEHGLYRS